MSLFVYLPFLPTSISYAPLTSQSYALDTSHVLSNLISSSQQPYEIGIAISILQIRNLRLSEVNSLQ